MVASYPVYDTEFDDPAAAAQYEQIIATVKASRSLLDAYGIKQDANSTSFCFSANIVKIQVEGEALKKVFTEQLQSISQLIGTKKIESLTVGNEDAESGYAVSSVSSEINVLLLVKVRLLLVRG
jgi:valyl-tRNA synthetase